MQLLQMDFLEHEIFADRFSDTGLRGIGGGDPNCAYHVSIQVMQDMAFVSIDKDTAALASVAHLLVFNANTPIFGNTFHKGFFSIFLLFYILLFYLLSSIQIVFRLW